MHFLDTRIRVQHPCPFCDFSAAFPDVEMAQWCNGTNEVLHITVPEPSRLPEVLEAARKSLAVREIFQDGRSVLTVSRACACSRSITISSLADKNDVWLIPPITYRDGWETHRAIAEGRKALERFYSDVREIGELEVLSHRPRERLDLFRDLGVIPVHFFGGLTDRQVRTLVSAYENGLLEIPARTRMSRVARGEGLSRSTFGEHLRKAQLQLLRNSYPYLKLRDGEAPRKGARRRASVARRRSGSRG